jgi:hypothetical protein
MNNTPANSATYSHPADKMFSLYLKEAEKVDRQMVEDWKGTTDGILIFVRVIYLSVLTLTSFLHRQVFSPLLLQHSSSRVIKAYQKQLIPIVQP